MKKLSPVDHVAIHTTNIKSTINWYISNFSCDTVFEDKTWALLKHIAFKVSNIFEYGNPSTHRDGINYIYKEDDFGNVIELVENRYDLKKEKS